MNEHSATDLNSISSATPYDDVFRTLIVTCRDFLYPLLNEVFGEKYDESIRIDFHQNEHFMEQQEGGEEKIITDESFDVLDRSNNFLKKYHLECQAYPDNSLCLRFFEYDSQIAKESGVLEGNTLTVTFPNSAVIFLRSGPGTPDHLYIRLVTPGGDLQYDVKVMKLQNYTIGDLLSHQLYLLVPFSMFLYEKQLPEFEKDEKKRADLEADFESLIKSLNDLVRTGILNFRLNWQ